MHQWKCLLCDQRHAAYLTDSWVLFWTVKAKEKPEGFRTFHTNANQVFSVDGDENTMVDVLVRRVPGMNLRTTGQVAQVTTSLMVELMVVALVISPYLTEMPLTLSS